MTSQVTGKKERQKQKSVCVENKRQNEGRITVKETKERFG